MVVAQRCLEEIVGRGVHFYPYLGAAHIDVVCILNKRAGAQVIFVQAFASAFYDGYISRRQDSLNTDAAFRLKMVAYDELLRLCDADGAVCQYDFIGTGIYHGRIGHEGVFPRQHFYGQHGEDGLQIAFTSGNDSFVVQQGKGKAAGGSRLVYQAEAAERVMALSRSSSTILLMARYSRMAFIMSSGLASRQASAFPASPAHASPTSSSVICP